jgi:hypothetical protein
MAMQMSFNQLVEHLTILETHVFPGKLKIKGHFHYHVRNRWFSNSEAQIPYSASNGVYVYTSMDNEVLYIGKGEYSSGGGIGHRSCSHIGSAKRDSEKMFPNHQWVDDDIDPMIKDSIAKGEFNIQTIPISPDHFVSFVEVYMQTLYFDKCNSHPPLNKKIG